MAYSVRSTHRVKAVLGRLNRRMRRAIRTRIFQVALEASRHTDIESSHFLSGTGYRFCRVETMGREYFFTFTIDDAQETVFVTHFGDYEKFYRLYVSGQLKRSIRELRGED